MTTCTLTRLNTNWTNCSNCTLGFDSLTLLIWNLYSLTPNIFFKNRPVRYFEIPFVNHASDQVSGLIKQPKNCWAKACAITRLARKVMSMTRGEWSMLVLWKKSAWNYNRYNWLHVKRFPTNLLKFLSLNQVDWVIQTAHYLLSCSGKCFLLIGMATKIWNCF